MITSPFPSADPIRKMVRLKPTLYIGAFWCLSGSLLSQMYWAMQRTVPTKIWRKLPIPHCLISSFYNIIKVKAFIFLHHWSYFWTWVTYRFFLLSRKLF